MVEQGLSDFAAWAWARHHNEWSWYLRPLFLIPYCWFAWRHSLIGLALTLLALATSMFWFPAPETPSPLVLDALAAEREYLLSSWSWWKVALASLVPATLLALALAFLRRSFVSGIAVVNIIASAKIAWTFVFFSMESALHHLVLAAAGLVICNTTLIGAWWWLHRNRGRNGVTALSRHG